MSKRFFSKDNDLKVCKYLEYDHSEPGNARQVESNLGLDLVQMFANFLLSRGQNPVENGFSFTIRRRATQVREYECLYASYGINTITRSPAALNIHHRALSRVQSWALLSRCQKQDFPSEPEGQKTKVAFSPDLTWMVYDCFRTVTRHPKGPPKPVRKVPNQKVANIRCEFNPKNVAPILIVLNKSYPLVSSWSTVHTKWKNNFHSVIV